MMIYTVWTVFAYDTDDYKLASFVWLRRRCADKSFRFYHHDGFLQRVVPSSPSEPDDACKRINLEKIKTEVTSRFVSACQGLYTFLRIYGLNLNIH